VKNECKKLDRKTQAVKKECNNQNSEYQKHKRQAEEHMNHSITFKHKFDQDKQSFEEQITDMYKVLMSKDEKEKEKEKTSEEVDAQKQDKGNNAGHRVEILKLRLSKIIATNKEKNRLMTQYLRNVKVLEDAFEQIKETTGITSTDEIVTSFIKA
jgi:coiled-coil domain-containing protein 63/114